MEVKKSLQATIEKMEKYNNEGLYLETKKTLFNKYDLVYSFTNERLSEFYKKLNYTDKVLTVASSGDHMLHSVLGGAKEITLFDINLLTQYYIDLKVTAIKNLTLEEFFEFFVEDSHFYFPRLKYEIFKKFCNKLPIQSFEYWNTLYEMKKGKFNDLDLLAIFEFSSFQCHENCKYINEKYYKKLSYLLNDIQLEFINTDIFEIHKYLKGLYSTMIFSNISGYFNDGQKQKYLKYIKEELSKFLIEKGMIQYSYNYYYNEKCKYNDENFSLIKLKKDSIGIYTKKRIK